MVKLGDGRGKGGKTSRLLDGKRVQRRYAHRGWCVDNVVTFRHIKCFPGGFAVRTLAHMPFPLIWPTAGDMTGAMIMIDAVMDGDMATLIDIKAQYPAHTFGFEDWMEKPEQVRLRRAKVMERTLKTFPMPRGFELRLSLVIVSKTHYQLQAVIVSGDSVMARKPIVTRRLPALDRAVPAATQPLPSPGNTP